LSEAKRYRSWTVQQKLAIVLAALRDDRSVADACLEHLDLREPVLHVAREAARERLRAPVREGGAHRAARASQACARAGADARPQDL
jgi:transposase-like protein